MVLGILTAIAGCPAIIGTTEAVRQGQRQNARERHRGLKTSLIATCSTTVLSGPAADVHGRPVVLWDGKLWVDTPRLHERAARRSESVHAFAGYFLPHPARDWGRLGEGLVSTVMVDPPQLNWVYVDADTHEVRHGLREACEGQVCGPWNASPVGKRLTLEGWEGFVALEERRGSGVWEVAFDRDDDGLAEVGCAQCRQVPIELERREMRVQRPEWAKLQPVEDDEDHEDDDEVQYYYVEEDDDGEQEDGKKTTKA
ncbi:hypothetical protein NA57DRAFT_54274 [Neofusicoccum parvum]|uniref:Uncharacterized protein n=1 Tax=Neofusicoccum parvum TaxID=310453 RepID=A0ACB5RPM8_9PEZI|nr:hypothetical protein NA57DRAFT_54274 [Neofusicoccum parvum]